MRILEFQVFILQCIQSRVFNLPHEMMLFKKKNSSQKLSPCLLIKLIRFASLNGFDNRSARVFYLHQLSGLSLNMGNVLG